MSKLTVPAYLLNLKSTFKNKNDNKKKTNDIENDLQKPMIGPIELLLQIQTGVILYQGQGQLVHNSSK